MPKAAMQPDLAAVAPMNASKQDPDPIDCAHLDRYTFGDQALQAEILGLFAGTVQSAMSSLRGAGSDRDWFIAAHTLKGSARAVGAWTLGNIAEAAEAVCVDDATARAIILSRIERASREAAQFIAHLRAKG